MLAKNILERNAGEHLAVLQAPLSGRGGIVLENYTQMLSPQFDEGRMSLELPRPVTLSLSLLFLSCLQNTRARG